MIVSLKGEQPGSSLVGVENGYKLNKQGRHAVSVCIHAIYEKFANKQEDGTQGLPRR